MERTWHNRIEEYLTFKGYKLSKGEIIAKLSNGTLTKACRGKKDIGSSNFEKIFLAFDDLSPTWLFKELGEMSIANSNAQEVGQVAEEFAVYLVSNKNTQEALEEIRNLSKSERAKQLVIFIEDAINKLGLENVELKNRIISLYDRIDVLTEKVERLL